MMAENILMVNYDAGALKLYGPLFAENGFTALPASTMQEALNTLLTGKYAGVVINADNFDYLPFLKVMRALTFIPIGVSASRYDKDEYDAAMRNGADIHRVRYDAVEYRVKNFSDFVKIFREFDIRQKGPRSYITCDDIRIHLDTRRVFVRNREVGLVNKEFDILHYLIINKGLVLSYDQIFCGVWGDGYVYNTKQTLRTQINRLRNKLRVHAGQVEYIKTVRGIGYCFDPQYTGH